MENNYQTTKDPKNIHMTASEREILHGRLMKSIGMVPSPILPTQSIFTKIALVAQPLFMILFGVLLSTSGILVYQNNKIQTQEKQKSFEPSTIQQPIVENSSPLPAQDTQTPLQIHANQNNEIQSSKKIETDTMLLRGTIPIQQEISATAATPFMLATPTAIIETPIPQNISINGKFYGQKTTCRTVENTKTNTCTTVELQPTAPIKYTLINNETQTVYKGVSNDAGLFSIEVPQGIYIIKPEKTDTYTFTEVVIKNTNEPINILVSKIQ